MAELEFWAPITGLDGYEVSDLGQVSYNDKVRKQRDYGGYKSVAIRSKHYRVHRLVAREFVDNPHNYTVVNHLNGHKADNRACNLEWTTSKGNTQHYLETNQQSRGTMNPIPESLPTLYKILDYSRYMLAKDGQVYSKRFKRFLKPSSSVGYLTLLLKRDDDKMIVWSVSRLVATVFIPNPREQPRVIHLNNDKKDNRVENLQWSTPKEHSDLMIENGVHDLRKKVAQYTLDGEHIRTYESLKEAAQAISIDESHISMACTGREKSAGGFMWRYYDNKTADIEPVSYAHTRQIAQYGLNGKLIRVYDSLEAAAASLGAHAQNLSQACGANQTSNGYMWRHADNGNVPTTVPRYVAPRRNHKSVARYKGDTLVGEFDTVAQAAEMTGHHRTNISKFLKAVRKDPQGYTWKYV